MSAANSVIGEIEVEHTQTVPCQSRLGSTKPHLGIDCRFSVLPSLTVAANA